MRVVVSAASGLIGSALTAELTASGAEVIRLVRRRPQTSAELSWDPREPDGGLDPGALRAEAVVHLSGAPIAPRRWTSARKAVLRSSRIESTAVLARVLAATDPRPGALLCASAIGYYGQTGDRAVDETAEPGAGFLAELVRDWEAAAEPARTAGIRVVSFRSGIVLAANGGALGQLLPAFRVGLGAKIGSGQQYMSWISLADEVRAIRFLLDDKRAAGAFNLTAPMPVTNGEFTSALARTLGRPAALTLPGALLRAALGEVASEMLGSSRVVPARLQAAGFTFTHADIGAALGALLPG
jgi:uncharacterized protein